ncbi:putative spermidine/putrescine transport system substrate-binding protein [Brevibacterium siliguriense]|uniref:Putative spermidine/putrescine transport system substrate-binding protein n=1 Tax=Brevibacterium siliguriense TaxID=1136497 RepID=A0A1H1SKN4_9MICO|nr:extracellular solute-binding protein [Brevibacterium siliguriense]SDS48502.1 putative spermidine/putrescine transport system substrate-binding protein [Brevibacterium siliguriense]
MAHTKMSRLPKLAIAVAGCISLFALTACGGPAQQEDSKTSGTVTLLGYSAVVQDNYQKAVIEPFEKKYPDITVEYVPGDNAAKMLGTLRSEKDSPRTDVVIMDTSVAETGVKEGLFDELTPEKVPNVDNVVDQGVTKGGYAATFDSYVMLYNKEKVDKDPTSWKALWEAPDQSVALDAAPDIQGISLQRIVSEMQNKDYKTDSKDAVKELSKLAPKVSSWAPSPSSYQAITDGGVSYATGWNARAQLFSDESPDALGVATPDEGTVFQINTVNMTKNSKHKEATQTFIDYALSTDAQKAFSEQMYYAPTVKDVKLNDDASKRVVQPGSDALLEMDWSWIAEHRDAWTEDWKREVIQ